MVKCPRCSVQVTSKMFEGTEVEYCKSCKGLILDRTELDAVATKTEGSVEFSIALHPNDTSVDTSPLMNCPKCTPPTLMKRIKFLGDSEIYLDRCDDCALLWLDKSELDKVNQAISVLNSSEAEWSFWMKVRLWASHIVI